MKAMVLNEYNSSLELIEMDTPRVKRDEILLKVRACGICQTDLKIIRGEIPPPIVTLPHIIGHEVVGKVVGVGEFVSGVDQGDVGLSISILPAVNVNGVLQGVKTYALISKG